LTALVLTALPRKALTPHSSFLPSICVNSHILNIKAKFHKTF
jgi:hypothetical protein